MKSFVILSEKAWHKNLPANLENRFPTGKWTLIDNTADFNLENLERLNPDKIFIPHWSYIIPGSIYNTYECVVFHMTDLPFGRGGSPLQNLIVRGLEHTKISALKVEKGIDSGPIYLKKDLSLCGTAEEVLLRAGAKIEEMIAEIVEKKMTPTNQTGKITHFKRREPKDSNIAELNTIEDIYDHIRMLDAEGYPTAYLETGAFRFEFSRVQLKFDKSLQADVRIIQK